MVCIFSWCGCIRIYSVYLVLYMSHVITPHLPSRLLGTDEAGGASGGGSGSGSGVVTTLVTKNIVLKDGTYASVTSTEVSGGGKKSYNNSNIIRCLHCLYIIVYTLLVYE